MQTSCHSHRSCLSGILHLDEAAALGLIVSVAVFHVAHDDEVVEQVFQSVFHLFIGCVGQWLARHDVMCGHVVVVAACLHFSCLLVIVELVEDGVGIAV